MNEQKYYIVWSGLTPGVYTTWAECQAQDKGVKGSMFKSFKGISRAQAEEIFRTEKPQSYHTASSGQRGKRKLSAEELYKLRASIGIIPDAIAVDASSQRNPGRMEYRGVIVDTGDEVFHSQVYPEGTNNIGEFMAIIHGMAWMEQNQYFVPIYTDSRTALSWIRSKTVKTNLKPSALNADLFQHLERAIRWLKSHDISKYQLLKWPTEVVGEIPADFGRK